MAEQKRRQALSASRELPDPENAPSPVSRHFTFWLDEAFRVPGTGFRFGVDPLLALIPGAGTVVATALGCTILLDAIRLRAPIPVLMRMLGNYGFNWFLGNIPLIGPFFDAIWRSNVKNLALLRRTIDNREQVRRATIRYWITALILVLGTTAVLLISPILLLLWLLSTWLG